MRNIHVAFTVESAHGHVNPILGIVSELVRRGCRVTCAVNKYFAPRVLESGAEPLVYTPLDYRVRFTPEERTCDKGDVATIKELWRKFEQEEMDDALPQLERIYRDDRPDLIVYDFRNLAGKALASRWNIQKLEHAPMLIESNEQSQLDRPYDENLVIATIPRFMQRNADELDDRFHFVGPIYGSRRFFKPWNFISSEDPTILVSATTAAQYPEFFKAAIRAFEKASYRIILSIGDEIDLDSLGPLPANFEVNQFSSQLEILERASLFIGHGGPGSTVEALYCGVPTLLVPPGSLHDQVASRIAELGAGIRLHESVNLIEELRTAAAFLLEDGGTRRRAKDLQKILRETNGAKIAADLILGTAERTPQGS